MMHPSRQAYVEEERDVVDTDGVDLANVPIDRDYFMPSAAAGIAPERASAILSQFSRKRRAAGTVVPTDDKQVRARLRELGEPITLFGEEKGDRRDRLRELLTAVAEKAAEADAEGDIALPDARGGEDAEQEEEFYTAGSGELLEARKDIARYSLPRAAHRLQWQKLQSTITLRTHREHRKTVKEALSHFELYGSQIAGDRPVSITRFSPSGSLVAAGNWAGGVRLLDVPSMEERRRFKGHRDRVGGLSWFPGATLPSHNVTPQSVNLASGGAEGDINLWSLDSDTPLATLQGHSGRVCRVEFHPSGRFLASASEDTTWRLWDVQTTAELLLQEGHSRGVYTVAFNTDGSMLASAGQDSIGRVWDLRTGRTIMILEGHVRPIYALDWGIDGHRILSGSGDGFAKCWDVRMVREVGSIGAHKDGVTDLRWFKGADGASLVEGGTPGEAEEESHGASLDVTMQNGVAETAQAPAVQLPQSERAGSEAKPILAGTFFVSSGFDKCVNVFSADDWALIGSLRAHEGNVLSVDVSRDSKWIASCGMDRTVKLWTREQEA